MLLRPVRDTEEDAEAVRQLAEASFAVLDPPAGSATVPDPPAVRGDSDPARKRALVRHLARTDPDGGWIAADTTGRPVGVAQSLVREGTWALALLAVLPEVQGKGVGARLLERAVRYGRACLRGMICSSPHPAAARVYRRAGLDLHPAMRLGGTVDPTRLTPPDGPVVVGSAAQRDMMDSVDRRLRGGAHGVDHEFMTRHHRLFVVDEFTGSGYCYVRESGRIELLAATSRRLAARLLTAALLSLPEGTHASVNNLTAEQQWAVDVGLAAGLELAANGYVCLRGMRPPSPYIPSGSFL